MASKRRMTGTLAGASFAMATAVLAGASANATTVYSTGFESPTFTTSGGTGGLGYVYGQGGFTDGPPTGGTVGGATGGGSSGSFSIQTYSSPTGGNSQYVYSVGSLPTGGANFTGPAPSADTTYTGASTPIVDVISTVGIFANGTTGVLTGTGDVGFGLTAEDGTAAQNAIADVQIDATTGKVYVGADASSFALASATSIYTLPTTAGSGLTFYSYELQLNYNTQTYNVFVAPNGSSTFTNEIAANQPFETAATTFSTAALDTETLGTGSGTGAAAFDNFSITAVPEPTTASLLIGGLAVAGTRRRRRSAAR